MIYIILPVFKRVELTGRFLDSVRNTGYAVTFVICDDEPKEYSNFSKFCDDLDVIALKTDGDTWWCKTVSTGIDYLLESLSDSEFNSSIIIIANNDVTVDNDIFNILEYLDSNYSDIIHPETKILGTDKFVSSGCNIISWFPYITKHPMHLQRKTKVDMLTARFLCMKGDVIRRVGNINTQLLQYHGDTEFTLRASREGFSCFIVPGNPVFLDDNDGSAIHQRSLSCYLKDLFDDTKSNSVKQKYILLSTMKNKFFSFAIVMSMAVNGLVKTFIRRIFG
ncbi:glycosyltransferase family 2 protein [Vibrio parahaemolyticus]|uniref:Uncharacterized protein n=1 Tax=Vibrio parahaemolyticus TaxID=670 RepID=A0A7M1W780_VIBPH|nr:glycosyltransferase family 2 protein [Vibrio parahaemolyticus]MCF9123503.1 glycosyltransferase family 2 protein [Vibrio parahaemolyticus]NCM78029.1 glycosyltransferase family 2 protein [Vibrio parahaemolyticus]QOS22893.1 hypothetical protein VP35_00020 [Vibrio parahaemolyticus]